MNDTIPDTDPAIVAEVVPPEEISARAATVVNQALNISPADLVSMRAYYEGLRGEYLQRVAEIEAFLSFAQQSDDLGVRIARLEQFLGVKAT
jgi:hypothetical protein